MSINESYTVNRCQFIDEIIYLYFNNDYFYHLYIPWAPAALVGHLF